MVYHLHWWSEEFVRHHSRLVHVGWSRLRARREFSSHGGFELVNKEDDLSIFEGLLLGQFEWSKPLFIVHDQRSRSRFSRILLFGGPRRMVHKWPSSLLHTHYWTTYRRQKVALFSESLAVWFCSTALGGDSGMLLQPRFMWVWAWSWWWVSRTWISPVISTLDEQAGYTCKSGHKNIATHLLSFFTMSIPKDGEKNMFHRVCKTYFLAKIILFYYFVLFLVPLCSFIILW